MAKFTFKGDPNSDHNPAACEMFGTIFPRGQAVEVNDENVIAKLSGNGHFEVDTKRTASRQSKDKADGPNPE